MWIESHQEIARHPKTRRLALKLGVSRAAAIGHLHLLWWWAVDYAQDGNLTGVEPEIIAEEAMWDGDPAVFVQAMVESEWLDTSDGRMTIHDWHDYAGKLIEARRKDAERKREARHSHEPPTDPPPSNGRPSEVRAPSVVTVPNPTVPNRTEDAPTGAAPPLALVPIRAVPKVPTENQRRQRAMFGAIVARFGEPLNKAYKGKYERAAGDLVRAGVDPDEFDHLCDVAEERWPFEVTPLGIAGNVRELRAPPKQGGDAAMHRLRNAYLNRAAREEAG